MSNRLQRALWIATWALLASWTPPPFHGWRRFLLRSFGAKVGRGARIYGRARIWLPAHLTLGEFTVIGPGATCYNQAPIVVEDYAIVSQGAHLCTGSHDIADPDFQLVARPITIGPRAWIAAEAFVGPGVEVGEGAVLGARAVAFRSLDPWTVYAGNPAGALKPRALRQGQQESPGIGSPTGPAGS